MLRKYNYLFLLLPLIVSGGCDLVKVKDVDSRETETVIVVGEEAKAIADTMKNVSKDDCKLMYMQFGGLSYYMSNTNKVTDTVSLLKLIESFQSDYSYTREQAQYKEYTDAVEAFLFKRGYEDAKDIVVNVVDTKTQMSRQQVIEDMQILADAAKLAMEKADGK